MCNSVPALQERSPELKPQSHQNKNNNLLHGLGVMVHAYNPRTWEAEAREFRVQGQPGLHGNTLSKISKQKINLLHGLCHCHIV
jgi:hypothetical protein